jgi:DNA-binding GntR family transcriptional regulator
MFGERFFATRDRLSSVIHGILTLADEVHADPGESLAPTSLAAELGKPISLIVCGEVNAGKSTLLNGLFGHDLCPVGILPVTDHVIRYRHGDPSRDTSLAPFLEEKFRPIGFFRDFEIIDTPGTNTGHPGHPAAIEEILPSADLILFVFPVSNPWGAATWDLIARMPPDALGRVVIIIQQADLREPCDLQVILGHMTDLSMKRLGRVPPIFAVSAKLACEAKRNRPAHRELLKASGYPALEAFISEVICHSPARRAILETWRGHAATALSRVEDHIDLQNRGINNHGRFIDGVEREIEEIREQFVARLPRHLSSVAEVFETEAVWATRLLHRRLAVFRSVLRLFIGDHTGPEMEQAFMERLQQTIEVVADKDGGEVADACAEHWTELGARVKTAIGTELRAPQPIAEILDAARKRFVQRIGGAAGQGIGNLRVRTRLDKELRRRNTALCSFVIMTLVLTTVGAACGALDLPWLPIIFCGLAALFLSGGVLVAWITRRTITRDFRQHLLDTCGAFASTLHSDYVEALRTVFRDYISALGNLRNHLAREKLAIEPRQRRWQELFLTLKAIEQEL